MLTSQNRKPHWSGIVVAGWTAVLTFVWSPLAEANAQCFYPVADTYVSNQAPNKSFENGNELGISMYGDADPITEYTYLEFNIDAIPTDATIQSASLRLRQRELRGGDRDISIYRVDGPWDQTALTWLNQPDWGSRSYDDVAIEDALGIRMWDIGEMVNEWIKGETINHGMVLRTYQSMGTTFDSHEVNHHEPKLCVQWSMDTFPLDIEVTDIEVTQSIQDLDNRIILVDGKRTYARVHVRYTSSSASGKYRTFAQLELDNDLTGTKVVHPINEHGGHVWVRKSPKREMLNHSILFEIPSEYTQGETTLEAHVNPTTSWRPLPFPEETDYSNNSFATTVEFEDVPEIGVVVYLTDYHMFDEDGVRTDYSTSRSEAEQFIDWVERAYPVHKVRHSFRRYDYGKVVVAENLPYPGHEVSNLTSSSINRRIRGKRSMDLLEAGYQPLLPVGPKYYGMVTDRGRFMRGSAVGMVGSGATGDPKKTKWKWDKDGSYGDWYGGHELGHTMSRPHTDGGCDSKDHGAYPNKNGVISPEQEGRSAVYGFDIGTPQGFFTTGHRQEVAVYPPDWRDMMTYCDNQWIGDFTYHKIIYYIRNYADLWQLDEFFGSGSRSARTEDQLLIIGSIYPDTGEAILEPVLKIPDAPAGELDDTGDHALVLLDQGGSVLAHYSFTPDEEHSGPIASDISYRETEVLAVTELLPYVPGTATVVLEGPTGELARLSPGTEHPSVSITSPQPGDDVSAKPYEVTWSASDPDGDNLTFHVQYSPDSGNSWELVAQNIEEQSVSIPPENLLSSDTARFRVWATDGLNTATDAMEGDLTLASTPSEVEILAPLPGTYVGASQTLKLKANYYIPGYASVPEEDVKWYDYDGFNLQHLGTGKELAVTGLDTGNRKIVVNVSTPNGTLTASVEDIFVVENPTLLPSPENELVPGRGNLVFRPKLGKDQAQITIDNRAEANPIEWQALVIDPWGTSWIDLQQSSSQTPGNLDISVNADGLDPGVYHDTILLSSPDTDHGVKRVPVTLWNYSPSDFEIEIFSDRFQNN